MSDKEIIKKLYTILCESSITKDFDKLNEILGTNYVLTHMTGMTESKEEYINSVKNGELKYYAVKHDDIDIRINGTKAEVIGKSKILASPFGMSKSWWKLKQYLMLEKINGKWIFIQSKVSTY
jgi:hypothetical protein